ncbi:hypothetical protein PNH38_14740 [Anoxybacillus rupiensis]|jgi:hypothetical protein|uniref:Uncharacterized protein n=1 Tax=Anoxybacteroides rupiense TaxID=311460 RepID=A0ABT5W710_9BACL|nr:MULTISPECIES: hypothetical protein [Anoxybacillus]MDE8565112.1 hypothetical protein [Anoxybacillus rupiensis]
MKEEVDPYIEHMEQRMEMEGVKLPIFTPVALESIIYNLKDGQE